MTTREDIEDIIHNYLEEYSSGGDSRPLSESFIADNRGYPQMIVDDIVEYIEGKGDFSTLSLLQKADAAAGGEDSG